MFDTIASDIAANFNSAIVVLGLMPTLLATIGPSIAEMAVLSSYRPFLCFLIALGAPAIWPTRLLEYGNPVRVLGSSGREARGVSTLGAHRASIQMGSGTNQRTAVYLAGRCCCQCRLGKYRAGPLKYSKLGLHHNVRASFVDVTGRCCASRCFCEFRIRKKECILEGISRE